MSFPPPFPSSLSPPLTLDRIPRTIIGQCINASRCATARSTAISAAAASLAVADEYPSSLDLHHLLFSPLFAFLSHSRIPHLSSVVDLINRFFLVACQTSLLLFLEFLPGSQFACIIRWDARGFPFESRRKYTFVGCRAETRADESCLPEPFSFPFNSLGNDSTPLYQLHIDCTNRLSSSRLATDLPNQSRLHLSKSIERCFPSLASRDYSSPPHRCRPRRRTTWLKITAARRSSTDGSSTVSVGSHFRHDLSNSAAANKLRTEGERGELMEVLPSSHRPLR